MVAPNRERAQTTVGANISLTSQDNFDYNPPDVGSTQTLGASVAARRRRLVDRYLDDPDVFVSTIRLEPGPSGELQVIITLEMADFFGAHVERR
ncbi:hypothetical protein V8E53_002267 [Lactarius tabidus]